MHSVFLVEKNYLILLFNKNTMNGYIAILYKIKLFLKTII